MLRGAEHIWPPSGTRAERGRKSEAQPNGEGVASGSATLIAKNLKKLFPSPKPLRTKSTLHHWTCGAFGMRGRCRLSCHSQATACGRANYPP